MGDRTKIEWADASWNPIRARNKATGGVGHYAAQDVDKVELFLDEKVLVQPLRWRRPRRIFVCSMTDLFGEFVPDDWIDQILAVMAMCPQHTFQVLTKRPDRMRSYMSEIDNGDGEKLAGFRDAIIEGTAQKLYNERTGEDPSMWLAVILPIPNVHLYVSVEDQKTANERIPHLLKTPAAVRGVSAEPLLAPVDFQSFLHLCRKPTCHPGGSKITEDVPGAYHRPALDHVIVGGESGPSARPMHPEWARTIRDQCMAAGVPFFIRPSHDAEPYCQNMGERFIGWQGPFTITDQQPEEDE